MRAKRSKKYRKIMSTYQLHFSFREPYQVLLDSNFLRAAHAFHMPLHQFLENTLHGKAMPYITQCTLAKVMEGFSGRGRGGRPEHLPPPTEIPLRYCKHKNSEGEPRGVIQEGECLVDLISGQAKGNETKRNKQHYIIAAADRDEGIKDEKVKEKIARENGRKRKAGEMDMDVRAHARSIPGVPIIYVKRSVMILEEPSIASERAIRGEEKEKFMDGLNGVARDLKRKRGDGDEDDSEVEEAGLKSRGLHKPKAPNPLSVRKKKVKPTQISTGQENATKSEEPVAGKRRRGKRGKKGGDEDKGDAVAERET